MSFLRIGIAIFILEPC